MTTARFRQIIAASSRDRLDLLFAVANRLGAPVDRADDDENRLFADDTVAVPVPHEAIGRMAARYRRDAVAPGLAAGNSAIAVVVVQFEGIDWIVGCGR